MRITRILAYRVELPLIETTYKWSGGKSVTVFDSTIVRVETDAGLVGHGEVCPLGPFYLPAYAEGVRAGLRELGRAGCPCASCSAGVMARTWYFTAPSRKSRRSRWRRRSRAIARKVTGAFSSRSAAIRTWTLRASLPSRKSFSWATALSRMRTRAGCSTKQCAWPRRCATSTSISSSRASRMKSASPCITEIHNAIGGRYAVFTGVDDLILESSILGIDGWVAGTGIAFPRENQSLWELTRAGHWDEARKFYRWFQPLMKLDTHPHFVQYIKLCSQETGLGSEWVRAPRQLIAGEERKRVLKIIRDAIAAAPQAPKRK